TLVTLLATTWHPVAGLAVAGGFGLIGAFTLAAQQGTQPAPHPRSVDGEAKPPMPWTVIVPLAVVSVALGGIFGSVEVITVAFSEEQGAKALAGPLLGLWAVGSLTAGLV